MRAVGRSLTLKSLGIPIAILVGASSLLLTPPSPLATSPAVAADDADSYEGQVVTQGTLDGDACVFSSSVSLVGTLSDTRRGGRITALVTDDCRLVVTSVTTITPTLPASLASGETPTKYDERNGTKTASTSSLTSATAEEDEGGVYPHSHVGYAYAYVHEYIDLNASEVAVGLRYTHRRYQANDGRNPQSGVDDCCFPGWQWRKISYTWWPDGPYVYIQRTQRFWNNEFYPYPDYTIRAKFEADPNIRYRCPLVPGRIPRQWELNCAGGLFD